jgi:hypothetical protein
MRRDALELVAAKVALGLAHPEELAGTATAALEDGLDSSALRVLAGLSRAEIDKAPRLLDRALGELNVQIPGRREAAMRLAGEIATDIADGTIVPYDGAKRIWQLTLRVPEQQLPELDSFVYAASEWEDRPDDRDRFEDGIRRAAHELSERDSP